MCCYSSQITLFFTQFMFNSLFMCSSINHIYGILTGVPFVAINDNIILVFINPHYIKYIILTVVIFLCHINRCCIYKQFMFVVFIESYNETLFLIYKNAGVDSLFGLVNKLALLHPMCILTSLSFVLYCFFSNTNYFITLKKTTTIFGLLISIFSVTLGSYWSSQEVLWGGWWNWDVVETSLLFLVLLLFLQNHKKVFILKNENFSLFFITSITTLLIFLFSNHTPIVSSIHSFVSSSMSSTSPTTLLLSVFCVFFYLNKLKSVYLVYLIFLYYLFFIQSIYSFFFDISLSTKFFITKYFLVPIFILISSIYCNCFYICIIIINSYYVAMASPITAVIYFFFKKSFIHFYNFTSISKSHVALVSHKMVVVLGVLYSLFFSSCFSVNYLCFFISPENNSALTTLKFLQGFDTIFIDSYFLKKIIFLYRVKIFFYCLGTNSLTVWHIFFKKAVFYANSSFF